jgi:hypothetical protein
VGGAFDEVLAHMALECEHDRIVVLEVSKLRKAAWVTMGRSSPASPPMLTPAAPAAGRQVTEIT